VAEEIGVGSQEEYTDSDNPVQDKPTTPATARTADAFLGAQVLVPLVEPNVPNEVVRGVALDPEGNTVVVGHQASATRYTLSQVGGNGRTYYEHDPRADVVLRKLSRSGEMLWARQFGDCDFEYAKGIAVGANGNIYIAGLIGTVPGTPGERIANC
jgi:hypothetical protein